LGGPRFAVPIVVILIAAAPAAAEKLDLGELAQCIADSGAQFYGAHWCPVCRKQKEYFGAHADALPYVECYDGPKSDGQNETCDDAGIESYPTWVFANGRSATGAFPPRELARKTHCLED
jgi:hypothetical protein